MGKSASGKDTFFRDLINDKKLHLKTIVTYTTRPMRAEETEGKEYYFVAGEQLEAFEAAGKIIERRDYQTVHGIWSYFTVDDGQIDFSQPQDSVIIGTLESYRKLREYYGKENIVPIYIYVEDGERLMRALERERQQESPRYAEMCRRFLADAEDFSEEKLKQCQIERIYENNDYKKCLEQIVTDIEDNRKNMV